jgi:hypothetical protein
MATRGSYLSVDDYVFQSLVQMRRLDSVIGNDKVVLEFGSGLGGNLISICNRIHHGIGIDVNPGYVRLARRIAARKGCSNLEFVHYNGTVVPRVPQADLVFSIGVFERLPKDQVCRYVHILAAHTKPEGVMALYFLSTRARGTQFTSRLGEDAYVYWEEDEVRALTKKAGLQLARIFDWSGIAHFAECRKSSDGMIRTDATKDNARQGAFASNM